MVNKNLKILLKGDYNESKTCRNVITVSWDESKVKKAVVICINPSKANDERSDKTITKTARYLDSYGYGEFTMLNLFENYSTPQSGIDRTTNTDFTKYEDILKTTDNIIVAWGVNGNDYKKEKSAALEMFKKYENKLLCMEKENGSKPMHPRSMNYETYKLIPYNVT